MIVDRTKHFVSITLNLISENGINKAKMLSDLELNHNSFVNWRGGKTPNAETVAKIAQYFNVTTDYLLGIEKPAPGERVLSENERQLRKLAESLPEEKTEEAINYLEFLIARDNR